MRRVLSDGTLQTLTVPAHPELDTGTCRAIFRQATRFVADEDLRPTSTPTDSTRRTLGVSSALLRRRAAADTQRWPGRARSLVRPRAKQDESDAPPANPPVELTSFDYAQNYAGEGLNSTQIHPAPPNIENRPCKGRALPAALSARLTMPARPRNLRRARGFRPWPHRGLSEVATLSDRRDDGDMLV